MNVNFLPYRNKSRRMKRIVMVIILIIAIFLVVISGYFFINPKRLDKRLLQKTTIKKKESFIKKGKVMFADQDLKSLKVVGIFKEHGQYSALLQDSNGEVREVFIGNQISRDKYRIVLINCSAVRLSKASSFVKLYLEKQNEN